MNWGKRIILVDDNMVNLRMGKILLEKDYSVITAPSAEKLFYRLG
jgi:CheY-like chemotaxis protein